MSAFVEGLLEPLPRHDLPPLQQQLADVCDWLKDLAKVHGPRSSATQRALKQNLSHLPEALWLARNGWAEWERRAALELVLVAFAELQRPGAAAQYDWNQRFGPSFTEQHYLKQLSDAVEHVAAAATPVPLDGRRAWVAQFLSDEACGLQKRRRLGDVGRDKLLEELAHLRTYLVHRGHDPQHEHPLPSPSAVLLAAYDAAQPAESRFARFRALVHALCILYETEHYDSEQDERSARVFVGGCRSTLLVQAAASFGTESLEAQVAAVDGVRDLLLGVCERRQSGRGMPRAVNVLDHLQRDADAAWCDNLVAAFSDGAGAPGQEASESGLCSFGAGARRARGFFPEARGAAW
ncbi:hypothetical protein JCM8208_005241 [Rhodotorula glutinis]